MPRDITLRFYRLYFIGLMTLFNSKERPDIHNKMSTRGEKGELSLRPSERESVVKGRDKSAVRFMAELSRRCKVIDNYT